MSKRILLVGVLALSVTGCASLGSQKQYGCNGLPNGVVCKSATDIYKITNQENPDLSQYQHKKKVPAYIKKKKLAKTATTAPLKSNTQNEQALLLPKQHNPIPLRTPAKIMRIWVAPWEDKEGDLHMQEFVYAEINARRWIVGDKVANTTSHRIHPYQVRNRVSLKKKKSKGLAKLYQ